MYFFKAQVRYSHCNGRQAQGNYCHLVETDLHPLFPTAETVWYVTAWVPGAAHLGIENTHHTKSMLPALLASKRIPGLYVCYYPCLDVLCVSSVRAQVAVMREL